MRIFHSKHQNLILQCYPPGKGADKKPNSSELSYLLYYASTRRVKLEKVVTFLKEKTESDIGHARYGNLQVTLAILSALTEKCTDNLNVFASFICSMLQSILAIKDLPLCKSVVKTYSVLCDKLDEGLFTGDKEFVHSFSSLSENLINLASYNSEEKKPNQLEWKMIALLAIKHISHCLGYNTKISTKFIGISIPFLMRTVQINNNQRSLLTRLRSNVNVEIEDRRLSKVISAKGGQGLSTQQIEEDFDNDALTATDINEEVFSALKALFNTSLTNQIQSVTKAVVKYTFDNKSEPKWGSTFLEMCTTWIPVQLRFVSLATLLSRLDSVARESNPQTPNYAQQFHYANNILGLVSSDVNMIGLSVSDIIRQVLLLQTNLILHQSSFLDQEQVKKLSSIYSNCICNLSSHIYYADQVPDSIQEILLEVKSGLEYSYIDESTQSEIIEADLIHSLILTLLDSISTIFNILIKKSSSITRNRVNLEHWTISLPILAPESEMEIGANRTSILSATQMFEIQGKYLKVFSDFLNHELIADGTQIIKLDDSHSRSRENFSDDLKDYTQPDINQYITHPDNFISHFLLYIDKFFDSNESPSTEIVLSILRVLKEMIQILGINFVSNYVPFLFHWSLKFNGNSSQEHSTASKYKDTIANIILNYCLKGLDQIYPEELQNYCTNSRFYGKLLTNISYRKTNRLWIEGLDSEPTDLEISKAVKQISSVEDNVKYNFTKDDLENFACGDNFTIIWIDHKRPITLDFINDPHSNDRSGLGSGDGSGPGSEVVSIESSIKAGFTGKGIGTAGDISSIYSDLSHHHQKNYNSSYNSTNMNATFNTGEHSNGSIITGSEILKNYNTPRISELKDLMSQQRKAGARRATLFSDNMSTSTGNGGHVSGSVLTRSIATTDVNTIIDGLNDDDDKAIVV
ncbi:hypothetical protein DFJ63DRAFT_288500 [Scheffersomyces coipomensis]|uniref:uncharacterized protein n=1 Tax=Scheffersomyces coipomensis TaxID=1788519 RepID=UPI00315C6589